VKMSSTKGTENDDDDDDDDERYVRKTKRRWMYRKVSEKEK
jgi:hypothetical protein